MNITKEIIKKLGLMGYPWKVSTILKYFLDENIKDVYGTSEMSNNDIDFTLISNSIKLESIYSDGIHVISVVYDRSNNICTIKCDKVVNDKTTRVFEITESPAVIENRFMGLDGIQKNYTYDKSGVSFEFVVSHEDEEQQVIDYKGILTPVYAKSKNSDWFTYSREYPPKEKEKSILKRIVDELSGRGCSRQIVTSDDATIDLDEFPYSIFGTLIADAKTILQPNKNSDKKRIRF